MSMYKAYGNGHKAQLGRQRLKWGAGNTLLLSSVHNLSTLARATCVVAPLPPLFPLPLVQRHMVHVLYTVGEESLG